MKKLSLTLFVLLAGASTAVFAGNLYVAPTLIVQHNSASHSKYTGMHPRLALGYGNMMSSTYYLAGEVFAVPFMETFSDSRSAGVVSAKTTRSFGISVIPGMMLNQKILGFLRLGLVSSKFPGPSVTKTGTQAGIGLMTSLTPAWALRGEYNYTAYKSISGLGSVKSNELGIGLNYKFA